MALTEGTRVIYAASPEFGIPMTVQAAKTVKRGDALTIHTDGKVRAADSDDGDQVRLIAGEDGKAGDKIPCYWMAIIDGFTGGTEAGAVYLSSTAGEYTETADDTAADTNTIIGYILTETKILVLPSVRVDSVVAT